MIEPLEIRDPVTGELLTTLVQARPSAEAGNWVRDADHPESWCRRCGGPNITWSAPSPLWNEVMRGGDIGGKDLFDGIVCPICFAQLAEERGVADLWRFHAERVHVPLATSTPSGRVWNPQTWMWEPPHQDGANSMSTEAQEIISDALSDSMWGEGESAGEHWLTDRDVPDAAGRIARFLAAAGLLATPGEWRLPAEPGPEVTAVRDVTGGVWDRDDDGAWVWRRHDGLRRPLAARRTWGSLLADFGPVTDATTEARP